MSTRTTLTITIALGLALLGGAGAARAAEDGTAGEAISTIRSIDPEQHRLVLTDGLELLATDTSVLDTLHEGEIVRVAFTQEGGRLVIDRIEQIDREPSPYDQMHVGEGETTGARAIKRGSDTFQASPPSAGDAADAYDGSRGAEAP